LVDTTADGGRGAAAERASEQARIPHDRESTVLWHV
jgi:hypothetical protein